mmetsp:Transcript_37341/g.110265  ORF Transcript_37341/g.110265 Transcript_37341/m.110265 type:complete len:214 (-) Transcript_37341:825-1466(-)
MSDAWFSLEARGTPMSRCRRQPQCDPRFAAVGDEAAAALPAQRARPPGRLLATPSAGPRRHCEQRLPHERERLPEPPAAVQTRGPGRPTAARTFASGRPTAARPPPRALQPTLRRPRPTAAQRPPRQPSTAAQTSWRHLPTAARRVPRRPPTAPGGVTARQATQRPRAAVQTRAHVELLPLPAPRARLPALSTKRRFGAAPPQPRPVRQLARA